MSPSISRRRFLQVGMGAAAGLAASKLNVPAAASGPASQPVATLLNVEKCVACGACVEACAEANTHKYPTPEKPFPPMYPSRVKVEDWSDQQDVDDRLTPYNWLFIQSAEVTLNGEPKEINIPRRCMHCQNPPCVKLCPWGAARQYDNGISQIDSDLCMGGAKCRTVCPWEIPQRQTGVGLYLDLMPSLAGNGVMYKCDRCYDRVVQGELPACIEACPEEVQTIGPRNEMIVQAHALANAMNGYVYGETENGGTHTIYVSPVPFDRLNDAVAKGNGRPHLNQVDDVMADNNQLARAMLIAPVAGIAAAVGKFYHSIR